MQTVETESVIQLRNEVAHLNGRLAHLERQGPTRYQTIVEEQTELICRYTADGTLTYVNEAYCRYFNRSYGELVGHSFMPLVPNEDTPIIEAAMSRLSPENPVTTITHRVILDNGELRWQSWVDRFIYNKDGTFIEAQAVGRDVTDEMELIEKLITTQKSLEQLLSERSRSPRVPATNGYLLQDFETNHLNSAVKRLFSKEKTFDKHDSRMVSESSSSDALASINSLTRRELEILQLVAQGQTNAEIAHLLNVRDVTVRTHVSNIMKKLDVENRVQATLFALRAGLVSLG